MGPEVNGLEISTPHGHAEAENLAPNRGARRMRIGLAAVVLPGCALIIGGLLTHFCTSSDRLASADQPLMQMQRMGPPPALRSAYDRLNSGVVAIRDSRADPVVATGIYLGSSLNPAKLPAFSSFLPASLKHILQLGASHTYIAVFVAPLRDIRTNTVVVDTTTSQLPGVVIKRSEILGLAAIATTADQDQLSGLGPLPTFLGYPLDDESLRMLILRRDPDYYQRSAGFLLTSGTLRGATSWCNVPISGADSGAPLEYVTSSGSLYLAGLAVSSPTPGRCSIIGAWDIGELEALLNQPTSTGASDVVPYLGVSVAASPVGAYVTSVGRGSPADAVGLAPGDVILRVGEYRVTSLASLRAALRELEPGVVQPVTFVRDRTTYTISVLLAGIPARDESR